MIGYCGTGYHGMQVNPPQKTIEGDLYEAMVKAGGISPYNAGDPKKSGFMRAARTDKGVHAAGNLISLKLIIEDENLMSKINEHLPETIRVWGIERTNKAFDCRKMCGSRVYEYLLPSYVFLAPKPSTSLAKKIEEQKKLHPGVSRDDDESVKFWEKYDEALKEANFTDEDLEKISSFKPVPASEFNENDPVVQLIRKYKTVENDLKRAYRISNEKLELMRQAMNTYLGHHNFHNFTLGKHFKDPSSSRYMKEITVSDPFVIDKTEWISIKIHGQSFMLHQIRKMIAMATLVVRTGCPLERISQAFEQEKVNIPKAPALGLLLEQPVYEGYNTRLTEFGYNPIDFVNYQKEMDAFKMKHIYDKIYAEEVKENTFNSFFNFIDAFQGDNIFDFLTAKGISKLDSNQQREIAIPTEKNEPASSED